MWAGGTDPLYRAAIQASHQVYSRVDICDHSGNTLVADIPFSAGSVSATLANRVSRQLSLTVGGSFFPVTGSGGVDYAAPLTPFGNRLRVWRGITYGDGTVVSFPAFYGRIQSVKLSDSGAVSVTGSDLAADVIDAEFEAPQSSSPGATVGEQVRTLIQEALPNAQFGLFDPEATAVPTLAWTANRGQALDDLAATVGMLWYPLADGTFVMRSNPWTAPGKVAVATYTEGQDPVDGGNVNAALTRWEIGLSRDDVKNAVIVYAERQGGFPPLVAVARDFDPTSPTYYLGNFGRVPVQISNMSASEQPQCQAVADQQLAQYTSVSFSWSPVSIPPDASLELGDLLVLKAGGVISSQVVTGFTLPLREGGDMSLTLHAYQPVGG